MAEVMRERCHGTTERRGAHTRCKHTTLKGIYCWQHMQKLTGLRVKKSVVAPRAGMGLFTVKAIAPKKQVTEYTGQIVESNDPNYGNPYVLQIKKRPPTFIDAKRTNEPGLGRWANDKRGANNAELIYNTRTKKAYIKSKKAIPANGEVTVPYGGTYWKYYNKKTVKKPKKTVAKRVR